MNTKHVNRITRRFRTDPTNGSFFEAGIDNHGVEFAAFTCRGIDWTGERMAMAACEMAEWEREHDIETRRERKRLAKLFVRFDRDEMRRLDRRAGFRLVTNSKIG